MTAAMTAQEHLQAANKPEWWKWAIALTASMGAVLEVIDTSIVNVALPDMQGNLGATLSEIGWVVTGYAMANVVIIPLSAWLSDYFGKKNYFIFSLIGFTLASILCGMSTTLPVLLVARIIQGLAGGGLLAKAQAIIFETFPPSQQGLAQAIFGLGIMVGPAIGPTLGGYLTDTLNWRWIFFINIPFGILAVICASIFFIQDKKTKIDYGKKIDWLGIIFLVMGLASFQVMLEQGRQYDWFQSPLIITMAATSVIGITLFVWQELTTSAPAVDLRVLRYNSLWAGSIFSMILGAGLYGALFAIPVFAQTILNFTAMKTGLLLLPGALASGAFMLVSGMLTKKFDARILIAVGALIITGSLMNFATINPATNEVSLFWPLIFRGIGTVLMYLPLTLATLSPIPPKDMAASSGFFNLTRQIGGSIGIAFLTTLVDQRQNFHRAILVDKFNVYNPQFQQSMTHYKNFFAHNGPVLANEQSFKIMDRILDVQAAIMSYGDVFWIVGLFFVVSLVLLFFLGNGKASKVSMADLH